MHAETARLLSDIATKHQIAVVLVSQAKSPPAHVTVPVAPQQSMDGPVWRQISANSLTVRRTTDSSCSFTDKYDFVLTSSSIHTI
ncbi:hypothetical protein COEREDRAFT_83971 [Coemansia reversa NRRL 1564]|uniref:DNA recombination and repair protein Rad51-like C-terminal domain-containing protein n=1 Tax=Coemansia reversa (strain ATCC 12441 / NRRL 1564) TaxID=763665 RepID=A0A2G5B0Y7_COERN|nr:hypothetical protein COEREDRAFT_83971 [Coemansia reversa NRRL 1564]|eukprot:PIA12669.1 hypothetical protein COEREDRAFT_83971 [Coemansia reversa NRRL 1564]